jgi:hypothetical protein
MFHAHEQGHEDGNDEVQENVKPKGPAAEPALLFGTVLRNIMSRHNEMPPVPPANHSDKGLAITPGSSKGHSDIQNSAEQGGTANIEQNTTNAGFYKGRRVK